MIQVINQIAEGWFNWQVSMFWQVGVLVILVACADFILRKWAWPQVRYALWLLILVKLVLPPALTSPASFTAEIPLFVSQTMENSEHRTQNIGEIRSADVKTMADKNPKQIRIDGIQNREEIASPSVSQPQVRELGKSTVFMTPATGALSRVSAIASTGAKQTLMWKVYLMGGWIIGIFILSAWVIVRLRSLRKEHLKIKAELPANLNRILESAARQLNLKTIPEISLSQKVCCPAVFGVFRPVLLLPKKEFENISEQDAENMFLHELAHIKRGDLIVHSFYMCLQIAYWFNPLLWLIRRHLQNLRELCCDATVARILREKTGAYRQTLLETAKRLIAEPTDPGLGLLGLFENSGRLIDRLRWLEKKSWRYRPLRIATVFILICLMSACVLPMAKNKENAATKTQSREDNKKNTTTYSAKQADVNNNKTAEVNIPNAAVISANRLAAENVPGKLVFQGRYRHHSRGKEIVTPSELWLKQDADGGINALAYIPWRSSSDLAQGDKENRLISYKTATQATEGKAGYLIELKFEDGKALLTRKGVREDRDNFPLTVPNDASFNPNSRPDSYCADNIFLRSLNLKPGEKKEYRVYDWGGTGDNLVDYSIQITNTGKEKVVVPAGDFEANHYVLEQVSSADTWFKKRAGHVTDYWVLDNNIIVRVLRHREPYEMELLDYSYPKDLKNISVTKTQSHKDNQSTSATENIPSGDFRSAPAEAAEPKPKNIYPIDFEITTPFLEGDSIEIMEILGSADTFEPGQTYTIKGKYTLASHDEAMLHIYATNGQIESEQGPVVRRGSGEFVRTFTYKKQGSLHLSFYPTNGGSGFGGIYFDQKDAKEKISDSGTKDVDVYIEDFTIQPYQAGGLYTLTAKIGNKGTATTHAFRMRFYKSDPQDNLNLFGKPQSGSHGAGPIKPGEFWSEICQPLAIGDGTTMFFVVLDFENTVAESNENNNQAILMVDVNEGKINKKLIGQSVIISRFPDGQKSLSISGVRTEDCNQTISMENLKITYDSAKGNSFSEAIGKNNFITITKSAEQREVSDVYIEDFKIQPYQAGGLYTLQVKIVNAGSVDVPWFRMNFYKGKPEDNINLFGNAMTGSYGAGPIKAGEYQNASSQPFALDKGENEFTAVLDIENTIVESNENNNSASLKILFENGKIKSK